jgi:two-component system, LuxR family, sensor kinase FixL
MPPGSVSPAMGTWPIVPVAAGALGLAIFVFDTFARGDIAAGVLYVAVVLMLVRSVEPRALLLVSVGCMGLAVLSHLLSHEGPSSVTGLANLAIDLSAIGTATYLALRNQTAERALTDQFRLVIDTIPTFAWRTRPDGYAEFFSQRWQDYTGLSLEQAQGWRWTISLHPDDVAGLTNAWRATLATGSPAEAESRVRRGDGVYRWFLFQAEPLRDERGNIVKWYGTYTDIEDRKRAEALLREQAGLLDLTHDTIFVRDMNDLITYWNRGAEERYGWPREQALGNSSHQLMRTIFPAPLEEITAALLRTGRWEGELVHTKRDGTQVIVASRWSLQRDEQGRAVATLETNNDITERRRMQEALDEAQANLARVNRAILLGEMTASIAHEVNQPIAAVLTSAGACLRWLAAQPPDLEEARQALQRIVKDGNRASAVISRIRSLVRKAPPRQDQVDINETILEVVALTRGEVQRNRVSLQTRLARDLPLILGDRIQLQQVLLNLIINAIEAMSGAGAGTRELLVDSGRDDANGVLVAVRDSGPGLNSDRLDRLFEAFYTTKSDGIGMGLAIIRAIVEAHGGRLWATPNVVQGAVFQFRLPVDGEETSSPQHVALPMAAGDVS